MRRESIIELTARERVHTVLEEGTYREMLGPFDRLESPWLAPQGIVPQSDDGVVVALGQFRGEHTLVIAVEGRFQGGSIGEVSGAKIRTGLTLALQENRSGRRLQTVLFLESGGVRLQEGNLGLGVIAEIQGVLVELRRYVPVTAVIAGLVGCFGGMAITAGLCSYVIMTRAGRLGLNGPEVIEQEAGIAEMDSADRALIWSVFGGQARFAAGLIDELIGDDVAELRSVLATIFAGGPRRLHRSEDLEHFRGHLALAGPEPLSEAAVEGVTEQSRGAIWFSALTGENIGSRDSSLLSIEVALNEEPAHLLAVVPDPHGRFPRARNGEIGLEEAWNLAGIVREVMALESPDPRPIIALVDIPSQAYGSLEEALGLFLACAGAVDAYAAARIAGHPVITLVVGKAFSGGYLAHGYQANRILALADAQVTIQAMGKESAARVTKRRVTELELLGQQVLPMSYDIKACAALGLVDKLIQVENAARPTTADVDRIKQALAAAILEARAGGPDVRSYLAAPARDRDQRRLASLLVRDELTAQWRAALDDAGS